jgi:general secretion pathway protein M
MLRPGSLVSRLLALVLLAAVVLLAWQGLIMPVIAAYQTSATSIAQSRSLLERYRALAELRPHLARQLEERRSDTEASRAYLEGPTDALAAAALQEQVRTIIADAGGELRSTQILPGKVVDEALRIQRAGLRLQLSVEVEGLESILYRLETAEPFLFIDEISIREQRVRRRRNEAEKAPELDVSLQVYGFVRIEGALGEDEGGRAA